MANNSNNLVKGGSLTRQKLQNSYESPEFSPVLGLIIFGEKSVATNLRSLVRSITIFFDDIYVHGHQPDYITLLACARG